MSYDWSDNVPPAKAERKTLRGWFAWQWYQLMIWAALDAPYDWINRLGLRVFLGPDRHKKHE